MDLELKDKVYIVTGGSKGIGEAITRMILQEGGKVMIATRSKEATSDLIAELDPQRNGLDASFGDLSHLSNCEQAISNTISKFGRIDGVITGE